MLERKGNHFNIFKLIKRSQNRFIKGRSCLTYVLELYEAVSDWVDEGGAVDVVYLHFQTAFDKVHDYFGGC